MQASPKRVLVVDDEELSRQVLVDLMASFGHEVETARDGIEALAKLHLDIDLVLLDVAMPGMDGYQVARRIREDPMAGDVPIVMVTALSAREDRLRAVEAGANDFIAKPADPTELRVRTTSLLRMKAAQDALKQQQAQLEQTIQRRTAALRQALAEMEEAQRRAHAAYLDTIQRLAIAAEFKDAGTAGHIRRIGQFCGILAEAIRLPPSEVEILRHATPMHDVGKIGIPDRILLKPGQLDPEEWNLMKQHTIIGHHILDGSPSELLDAGAVVALSHHEKWDGTGYPGGLAGEEIPLWGRICAVADLFDAYTSERPYKSARSNEDAWSLLRTSAGTHLDPRLVEAFLDHRDAIREIQEAYAGDQQGLLRSAAPTSEAAAHPRATGTTSRRTKIG
ncbi:MAG: response regulator [Armatimonadota bacterium]|nr:response regulator [Armatimonadota bacterium]